jgi:uncharacterized protein YbaR (Trm112 family)
VFIELTDHLRCPADHEEQYLILVPEEMDGRDVRRGSLNCPVCHRQFPIEDGVARFGRAPGLSGGASHLDAEAIAALAGLGGPGGYLVMVGGVAREAARLADAIPGVAPVLVNPPEEAVEVPFGSRIIAPRIPLKSGSMRAVVLGPGAGSDNAWIAEAARVTLVGNRVVGEGAPPAVDGLELSATADGVWVAVRKRDVRRGTRDEGS